MPRRRAASSARTKSPARRGRCRPHHVGQRLPAQGIELPVLARSDARCVRRRAPRRGRAHARWQRGCALRLRPRRRSHRSPRSSGRWFATPIIPLQPGELPIEAYKCPAFAGQPARVADACLDDRTHDYCRQRPVPHHRRRQPRRSADRAVPRRTSRRSSTRVRRVPRRARRGARGRRPSSACATRSTPKQWFEEHDEELAGGWDAIKRDQALDGDGVAARGRLSRCRRGREPHVRAVRRRPRSHRAISIPVLGMAGAKAHNRWLAELCAHSPQRRCGVALVPITGADRRRARRDPPREGVRSRRGDDPRDVVQPDAVSRPSLRPGVGAVRRPADAGRDALGCRRRARSTATTSASTSPRSRGGRPARCGSCCGRACSNASPVCASASPRAAAGGCRSCCGRGTACSGSEGLGEAGRRPVPGCARCRCCRASIVDRNCFTGLANVKRRELGMRYEIGIDNMLWGTDFPHPEGTWPNTHEWLCKTFFDIPIDETRRMLGLARGRDLRLRRRHAAAARRQDRPDADRPRSARRRPHRGRPRRALGAGEGGRPPLAHRPRLLDDPVVLPALARSAVVEASRERPDHDGGCGNVPPSLADR